MLHDQLPEDKPEIALRCPWCPLASGLLDQAVALHEATRRMKQTLEDLVLTPLDDETC